MVCANGSASQRPHGQLGGRQGADREARPSSPALRMGAWEGGAAGAQTLVRQQVPLPSPLSRPGCFPLSCRCCCRCRCCRRCCWCQGAARCRCRRCCALGPWEARGSRLPQTPPRLCLHAPGAARHATAWGQVQSLGWAEERLQQSSDQVLQQAMLPLPLLQLLQPVLGSAGPASQAPLLPLAAALPSQALPLVLLVLPAVLHLPPGPAQTGTRGCPPSQARRWGLYWGQYQQQGSRRGPARCAVSKPTPHRCLHPCRAMAIASQTLQQHLLSLPVLPVLLVLQPSLGPGGRELALTAVAATSVQQPKAVEVVQLLPAVMVLQPAPAVTTLLPQPAAGSARASPCPPGQGRP